VTATPRVCVSCGAKNHPQWRLCQRCGTALTAVQSGDRTTDPARVDESEPHTLPWRPALALAAVAAAVWFGLPSGEREAGAPSVQAAGFAPVPMAPPDSASERQELHNAATLDAYADRRGVAAYGRGDMAAAASAFEEAVATNPEDAESLNNLGQVLVRQGRLEEALPLFDRAVALSPQKWAFRFNQGRARGLVDDWSGAIEAYQEADRLFPNDHVTLFNLGLALRKVGRHEAAAGVLERVVAQETSDATLYLPLGESYESLDRPADAIRVYQRYLEVAPAGGDAPAVRARIGRLSGEAGPAEGTENSGDPPRPPAP
jgi:Flp pilus assembly protein TadD